MTDLAPGKTSVLTSIRSPVMVGRDRERARIEAAALAAVRGASKVVVVRGDTGVGKSRLCSEAIGLATTLGMVVLKGECSETQLSLPYLPVVEALGAHLADESAHGKLRAALGDDIAPLARILPQLPAEARFDSTGTSLDKLRLFESIVQVLRVIAGTTGLLLVIEDVHWADGAMQELLDHVVRRLQSASTLVLLTSRYAELERSHPVRASMQRWLRAGADPVDLQPLGVGDVAAMTAAILDVDSTPEAIASRLHERTDGLPLAVEELVRQAIERGHLRDVARAGWDSVALADVPPPQTLTDAFLVRIQRLSKRELDVVRAAAVLGRSFDFVALQEMTSVAADTLMDVLETVSDMQLIEEDQRRENGYRFRHILIRDAIYNDILVSRRRLMHGRAADAIRVSRPDDLPELAHHLIAAGRAEEAARACANAAQQALRHLAARDAMELFAQALAHSTDARERARLECSLGEAAYQAGDIPAAQERLEAGVTALEDLGDAVLAAHHRLTLGRCLGLRSFHAAAESQYEQARAALEEHEPGEDLALVYNRLAGLHAAEFDAEAAERLAERALVIAAEHGLIEQRVAAEDWHGMAMCLAGKLDAGLAELERSRDGARVRGLHILETTAAIHQLSVLETYGRAAECAPLFERLRALPENPYVTVVIPYYESWLAFWSARLVDAARAASRCIDVANGFGMQAQAGWGRGLLCLVATELGDIEAARELVPARDHVLQRQERVEQGWVALRFHLAAGDLGAAEPLVAEFAAEPWAIAGTALSDAVVYALIAMGRPADAAALVDALGAHLRSSMHPGQLLRSRGRLALVHGDGAAAAEVLRPAAAAFEAGGYRLEVGRTHVLLGRALALMGDEAAAHDTLAGAARAAAMAGATLMLRNAEAVARESGVVLGLDEHPAVSLAAALGTGQDVAGHARQMRDDSVTAVVSGASATVAASVPADRASAFRRWAALAVEQHHGAIDDLSSPDIVAATFNRSGWHEDHTRHALDAALEIIRGAARLGVHLGAGIATGPRGAGASDAGAHGVAAGLHAAAGPGEILMNGDAYERVREHLPSGLGGGEPSPVRRGAVAGLGHAMRWRVVDAGERQVHAGAAAAVEPAAHTMVREGEFWTLTYAGSVVRLKDSKGLHDLARLLGSPGTEMAAVDLAGVATPIVGGRAGAADVELAPEGDAGELLDERARAEYRQRLIDLEAEVADAEAANDPERASRARQEREFIIDELGAAVGLMGKSRRALDPAERARKAVTWRLRDTIARIAAADTELGRHLRHSVRTGAFCVYDPAVPTRWSTRG